MRLSRQNIRGLGIFFVVSTLFYSVLLYYFFVQTRAFAFAEGEKQVESVLLTHKAIHSFVEMEQKPEVYRLKKEGFLYSEYFSPQLLSRTFIARGIQKYFNQEREKVGLAPLYFKLAAESPRNMMNAADTLEGDLLQRMRSGELEKYSEMVKVDGRYWLYYAIPIGKTVASCLQCHGDPQAAPQELLEKYGDTRGFHESEGEIRALISVRVPLDAQIRAARSIFVRLSVGTGFLLLLLFVIVLFSVTLLERHQRIILSQNEELSHLATVDMLTGVYNRQGFVAAMARELALGDRYKQNLSLILLDIDFFKKINDTYGHGVGDTVLTAIGKLLREAGRAEDITARWGGEEFVVACPRTGLDGAAELAGKIRAGLDTLIFDQDFKVTASFGVAPGYPKDTLRQLIDRADLALYRAKEQGRNQICLASPDEGMEGGDRE